MRSWLMMMFLGICAGVSADSVNLLNDSPYTLKVILYDAKGSQMGSFVLNPQDASSWSNDDRNFGSEMRSAYQVPYTVMWHCMSGSDYGSCNNVASGATVTAQGCGGTQQCGALPADVNADDEGSP